jgi:hypothetical protein
MYLASFIWPGHNTPLCIGTNKRKVHKRAYDIARELYGTGLVERPKAMCSAKIAMDDIQIEIIEEVK